MVISNVRIADLIKILVQMVAKGHQYVDLECSTSPDVVKVFPALRPLPLKTLEEEIGKEGPLDDATLAQLI